MANRAFSSSTLADQEREHIFSFRTLLANASLALVRTNTSNAAADLAVMEQKFVMLNGDPQLQADRQKVRTHLLALLKHPGAPHFQPEAWQAWQVTRQAQLPGPAEQELATHITTDLNGEFPGLFTNGDAGVQAAIQGFMPYGNQLWEQMLTCLGNIEEALAIARAKNDEMTMLAASDRKLAFWERRNADWRTDHKELNQQKSKVADALRKAQNQASDRAESKAERLETFKHKIEMQRSHLAWCEMQQYRMIQENRDRDNLMHAQNDKELEASARNIEKEIDAMEKVEGNRVSAAMQQKLADHQHELQKMRGQQDELRKARVLFVAQGMVSLLAFLVGVPFNIEQCLSIAQPNAVADIRWWHIGAWLDKLYAWVAIIALPPRQIIGLQNVLIAASVTSQAVISLVLLTTTQRLLPGGLYVPVIGIFNVFVGLLVGTAVGSVLLVTGQVHDNVRLRWAWAGSRAIRDRWCDFWLLKGITGVCIAMLCWATMQVLRPL
jgi:hypothetical protein